MKLFKRDCVLFGYRRRFGWMVWFGYDLMIGEVSLILSHAFLLLCHAMMLSFQLWVLSESRVFIGR